MSRFAFQPLALAALALCLVAGPAARAADLPVAEAAAVTQATTAQTTGIATLFARFNALFASAVPAANDATLLDLFAADLLDGGDTRATVLSANGVLSADNVGITLTLNKIVSVAADGKTLLASFIIKAPDSTVLERPEMQFILGDDGKWRFWGDRRPAYVEPHAINKRFRPNTASAWSFARMVEFWIDNGAPATVAYVRISGPGLPASQTFAHLGTVAGIVLGRTVTGGNFNVLTTGLVSSNSTWIPECSNSSGTQCVDLSLMKASSRYTLVFYGPTYKKVGATTTLGLHSVPYSNAQAQTNQTRWFATPKTFKPALAGSFVSGSTVALTWTLPTDATKTMGGVGVNAGNGDTSVNVWKNVAARATSLTFGKWTSANPPSWGSVWLHVDGADGHQFISNQNWPY
ncbi:hypothetical protein [Derxia lacustris]|uniref:hypothetical protein n=1 Tax=Derxia lacustris TaxID=764842 RepID=UPI000A16E10D|nr:hypothetical protein [Derxia lacustris]